MAEQGGSCSNCASAFDQGYEKGCVMGEYAWQLAQSMVPAEAYERVEREHAALSSMVEKAVATLHKFKDFDPGDDLAHPAAVVRAQARLALKAMSEIGGYDV